MNTINHKHIIYDINYYIYLYERTRLYEYAVEIKRLAPDYPVF